jgi:hypothetical protein
VPHRDKRLRKTVENLPHRFSFIGGRSMTV